jgi:hypothetical protein
MTSIISRNKYPRYSKHVLSEIASFLAMTEKRKAQNAQCTYSTTARPRIWTPDFYIPDLGMYIEVVGESENPNYSWRESIYKKNKVPIIFIHPYDYEDWKGYLLDRMFAMQQQRWELLRECRPVS